MGVRDVSLRPFLCGRFVPGSDAAVDRRASNRGSRPLSPGTPRPGNARVGATRDREWPRVRTRQICSRAGKTPDAGAPGRKGSGRGGFPTERHRMRGSPGRKDAGRRGRQAGTARDVGAARPERRGTSGPSGRNGAGRRGRSLTVVLRSPASRMSVRYRSCDTSAIPRRMAVLSDHPGRPRLERPETASRPAAGGLADR
jgi:hypothetical protein